MPDLATFEARERKRINWTFGLLFGLSVIFTVAWAYFQKSMLLLGPLGLLVAPLLWVFQRYRLSTAMSGRNPVSVVEMFVTDVNEMLANESSPPAFAYEALAPETKDQVGDVESFHQRLRASLMDSIAGGLASEMSTGKCERCAASFEFIPLPDGCSAGLMGPAVRCSSCQKLYCTACAPDILNRSDKCVCGRKLGWDDVGIIPRSRFLVPYLKIDARHNRSDDRDEVRLDAMAMYRDTGVTIEVTSGGIPSSKFLAYVTAAMVSSLPMRRVNERWIIEGVPNFTQGDAPIKERWVEAPDPFFA